MRAIRPGAWAVLLLLAACQAWFARFYATPDGVSYLDLSDAVLGRHFGELLNAYWSPLYPALIGILRAILRPTEYWEFGVVHLLNFLLFIASLLGYEYFLAAVRKLTDAWGRPGLGTKWGTIGAYTLFGAFTLLMTPLTLPTPDLLVSAACFFVFGALLRIHGDDRPARAAVVLGLALAAGSLAKSFVIPWAVICLVTAAVALRGRGYRPALVATAVWLVAVLPWTIGLSARTGHVTFGDTGRLTYVWYVNRVESPSTKRMPSGATTPAVNAILPGVAVTPDARGTNPVWYDPARWYSGLTPRFDVSRQAEVFTLFLAEYMASLGPVLLVLFAWLVVAGRDELTAWWRRTWVVMLPSLAAIAAYSLVLVTTRYVAPFWVAMTLTILGGIRWPASVSPTRAAVAVGVPLVVVLFTPRPENAAVLMNAAAGSVLFVWLARHRSPSVMIVAGVLGAVAVRVLQPSDSLPGIAATSALLILVYWAAARASASRDEPGVFSGVMRGGLLAANTTVILIVAALKYHDSFAQPQAADRERNGNWYAARQAATAGMKEGDRIALVGSPFDAYWVRTGRMQIVAAVPPPVMARFNALPTDRRAALYEEFGSAGARWVVVQQPTAPGGDDAGWVAVPYIGWVRSLPVK